MLQKAKSIKKTLKTEAKAIAYGIERVDKRGKPVTSIADRTNAFVSKSMAPKEYLELENACVKACNNDLSAPKEKHVRTLLLACGGGQGNLPDRVSVTDINYVLNSITKVIGKATGWISMLKSHVVLHRLFQECGGKFQREFFHHAEALRNARSGGKEQDLFSLRYWKDDSSQTAFELSGWVRAYALYFEEFTCCAKFWPFLCSQGSGSTPMQAYNFDQLLQHVPVAQTLMRRLTDCDPAGEVLRRNDVPVRAATALMFKDSLKVFKLANEGVCALVGLFFEQDKSKARKGLEIYKRSVIQHEDLQRLYATCQKMQIVNQAPALEAPPESFLGTMQETSGGSAPPSESSLGAAAAATSSPSGGTVSPQQNANATLDAFASSVVAGRNFLPAGTTASAPNDDPFGLTTITNTNGTGGNSNRGHQPAASTSANLLPPVRAHQQQQQHVRNGSNNPFGDDLFGTPKKAVAAPVDLNSLYEQANTRQQQQHQQPQQQPQYGGGMMPPPMGGGMPQQMMMGNHPGYYQQQQTQHHHHSLQQQQQQQTSPPHYGGVGGGYSPQAAAAQNMGYLTMMAAGGQYHSPPQNFHPQQQQHFPPPLQQQQQQQQSGNNNNNNNNFLL
ncbi:unnamed protein product [Bathycoccus prasinos]